MELTLRALGSDELGSFQVYIPSVCGVCNTSQEVVLKYTPQSLRAGLDSIEVEKTILKKHTKPVGLTCGCYAKFHRQVAHIRNRQQAKSAKKK